MDKRTRSAGWIAAILMAGLALAPAAWGQDAPPPAKDQPTSGWDRMRGGGSGGRSWAELRAASRDYFPNQWEDAKLRAERMRIVVKPRTVLSAYESDPGLWSRLTEFYDTIKGRELDMFAEQPGVPEFFTGRDAYYDFLDTMLPAMRDRMFERNRLLTYQVHEIKSVSLGEADVIISITSDDTFPFKKTMLYTQRWSQIGFSWYPGKIAAKPATWWERVR